MNDIAGIPEDYDVILYIGDVCEQGYQQLTDLLARPQHQKTKAYFIPVTNGGDPNMGYRIGRALGHYYPDDLIFFIPDRCKSAGTLMAIGSNELVISDRGTLGPLDIQLANKDELFEMSSGLDIMQALQVLQDTVKAAFRSYLVDLRIGANLSTKISAQLASEMASNLVKPISSQIDPIKLGEHQRALLIASAYGKRLNEKFKNTKPGAIDRLSVGYPTHSFVIDRKEAAELFERVRCPNEYEAGLERRLRDLDLIGLARLDAQSLQPLVINLTENDGENDESKEDDTGEACGAGQ